MRSFDRLGNRSGAVRWRMPLALLLSVLAHLLALTGVESRFGVADRGPQPQTMTVELLPPPAPPVAVAPPPLPLSPPARPSPREASPPMRAAAPRPRSPRRPAPAPTANRPPLASAEPQPAGPSPNAEPRLVVPAPGSEPLPTDPFPALGQADTDPAADAASSASADAPGSDVAAGEAHDASPQAGAGATVGEGAGSGSGGTGTGADRAAADPAAGASCAGTGDAAGPVSQAAPLPAPPAGGRWVYDVFFGEYTETRAIARVEYRLQLDGDRYAMRSEGSARGLTALFYSGLITQSSTGRIGAGGVQPERYVEQRGKRAPRAVEIDRAHCEVVFGDGSRRPLVDGAQDRLSSLLQLGLLARGSPASFDAGRQIELPELTNSSVQIARYRSEGAQQLDTDDGPLRALHLVRLKGGGEEPTIEIWLGYDHAMLPVRIRVTEYNGRVFDQLLSKAGG